MSETQNATPAETLEQRIMDPCVAKSEAEWWAHREIERHRAENEKLRSDRRERIATAALQGLLSNPATSVSPWEVVVAASVYADLMIAKLDEEPQP